MNRGGRAVASLVCASIAFTACSDDADDDAADDATASDDTVADVADATTTDATTTDATTTDATDDDRFPDVVDATATYDDDSGTWSFAVTMSSPYDTPERYADGWRVMTPDGTVLGVHTLMHDHASEQPFTRTQRGVSVPDDVDSVVIEGRDQANGFGGATATITLDRG